MFFDEDYYSDLKIIDLKQNLPKKKAIHFNHRIYLPDNQHCYKPHLESVNCIKTEISDGDTP